MITRFHLNTVGGKGWKDYLDFQTIRKKGFCRNSRNRSWFTWSSSWRNVAGSSRRMIRENTRPSSLWTPYWKKTATFPQSYANLADCGVRSGDMARLVSLLVRFELTLYRTPLTLLSCWKKYSACYGESILKRWGFLGPKKTKCPAVRKFLEFLQKPFFLMVWKSK